MSASLVLVSNRGPVTYDEHGDAQRGSGGLVTALTGLASHREVRWIASAMTDSDARVAAEHGGGPFLVRAPGGGEYNLRLVVSDPQAYDRFYNVFANPMLWFIQHYLWDLSNAPDIRREEIEAFEFGYNVVNEDLARAVVEELGDDPEPVVMVHDYHLYTLPDLVRRARPEVFLHHFIHIPWTQPDAWRVLPSRIREDIFAGCSRTTSSAFTRAPTATTSCSAAATSWTSRSTSTAASCASATATFGCALTRCRSITWRPAGSHRASA